MMKFQLESAYEPAGDQPEAISKLTQSISQGSSHQTLLGVTGSGKTFTIAKVIEKLQLPTLIISHNKTLASQLYQEFRDFFPHNAVSYFVSYYDYYQPEAYIPQTDTYIEKEADINPEIDKLRLATTANLLSRPDAIVIASVSCIYNLGSPLNLEKYTFVVAPGEVIDRQTVILRLIDMQYHRTTGELQRGTFRVTGNTIQLFPSYQENIISLHFSNRNLDTIEILSPLDFEFVKNEKAMVIYPAKQFITSPIEQKHAFAQIETDLQEQLDKFRAEEKIIEARRLEQKVHYDLSMLKELGYVNGIENYSRYFDGRHPGDPPYSLIDYFHYNVSKFKKPHFLTVIDESHITLPQIRGMFNGDFARKKTLIDFGFRLPAAYDNRPLTFQEFSSQTPTKLYVSATPGNQELSLSKTSKNSTVVEQLIRPTWLLDPEVFVFPTTGQIKHITEAIIARKKKQERVLVLTLTKKMAEDLAEHLSLPENTHNQKLTVEYLHSDIKTLDRSDILDNLRSGQFDCLIGVNLLREGLDLPEVSLVAILDADKEGFLRTSTALIQTIGRAARHIHGQVFLYADRVSDSMKVAIGETERRRTAQKKYNQQHHLTPVTISKPIRHKLLERELATTKQTDPFLEINPESLTPKEKKAAAQKIKSLMLEAADNWDFELAANFKKKLDQLK